MLKEKVHLSAMKITCQSFMHLCIAAPQIAAGLYDFVAARIDFIFVLSERATANFPQQAGQPAGRGRKAIQGQPTLAITDGSTADDSWGPWHSSRESFVLTMYIARPEREIPAEMLTPGAPETAPAVTPEASDLEDLMASAKAFRGDGA